MKRILNYLLAISFILTIMVPITGIIVHKLAATLFLILALIHVFLYRKKIGFEVYSYYCINYIILCFRNIRINYG
jgi:DMSO/TMAO reductase YedYZ heme-binding membrane subunit